VTRINTDYWNKKFNINRSVYEESFHGQIPWILLYDQLYPNQTKETKNKVIALYLYFTKFYNKNNGEYIFKNPQRKIFLDLKGNPKKIKDTINFMESVKLITKKGDNITLLHHQTMERNKSFFKNKDTKQRRKKNKSKKAEKKIITKSEKKDSLSRANSALIKIKPSLGMTLGIRNLELN